jgi:hypothetical protein
MAETDKGSRVVRVSPALIQGWLKRGTSGTIQPTESIPEDVELVSVVFEWKPGGRSLVALRFESEHWKGESEWTPTFKRSLPAASVKSGHYVMRKTSDSIDLWDVAILGEDSDVATSVTMDEALGMLSALKGGV